MKFNFSLTHVASHIALMVGAFFMLMPFIWMLSTAFKPPQEIFEASLWPFPKNFYGFQHFSEVLKSAPIGNYMLNGVIVCTGILFVQLLVAIPAAYALAKLNFAGRELLFICILAALSVPIQATSLPIYIAMSAGNLLNTYFAQMLPFFLSMFAIFLLRQNFKSFPDEIIHAARLDGMSELEIVWRVVTPSAIPAITAFSIFSLVAHWNDLYWPLIVISSTELAPPPLGMLLFASAESGANYGALMAGATLITAPIVIAFLIARRRFIQGITMTSFR
jgi:multiple sugar transport system permease protein